MRTSMPPPPPLDIDYGIRDVVLTKQAAPRELEARLRPYTFKSRSPTAVNKQMADPLGHFASRHRLAASPKGANPAILTPLQLSSSDSKPRLRPLNRTTDAGKSMMRSRSVPAFSSTGPGRSHSAGSRGAPEPGPSDIGKPYRVEPPAYMQLPARVDFRPVGEEDSAKDKKEATLFRRKSLAAIQDCSYRANACRRAGRTKAEASAYLSMGIHYDNIGDYVKAARCFMQVVVTLEGIVEDMMVSSVAFNSIAIALFLAGRQYWDEAIKYNQKHLDCSGADGKFAAFTNLGLLFNARDDHRRASECNKDALRCALKLKSVHKQAIAIGNLGLSAYRHEDLATAEACMERHLQLSKTLGDLKGQAVATQVLGEVANRKRNFGKATGFFREAIHLSGRNDDARAANKSKVHIGVALAQAQMEERMREAAGYF